MQFVQIQKAAPVFDGDTAEETVAAFVDSAKLSHSAEMLASLLPEQHPLYHGRGTNQAARLRGYIMAAFETAGFPDSALVFALDELQNGHQAYLVAAAAVALRGAEVSSSSVIPYLFKAIDNIKYNDDSVSFESYRPQPSAAKSTTALLEIFKTFEWLGAEARPALPALRSLTADNTFSSTVRWAIRAATNRIEKSVEAQPASCCSSPTDLQEPSGIMPSSINSRKIPQTRFEDHDSNALDFSEFFIGKITIVVFFYTRCENPNKCSLTITKLGQLQNLLREKGLSCKIRTAAITYDPGFDIPSRIKDYAEERRVSPDAENRLLRTTTDLNDLQEYFQLGVNYVGSLVNRHRVELYILNEDGQVAATFAHLQWDIDEVLNHARLLSGSKTNSPETL